MHVCIANHHFSKAINVVVPVVLVEHNVLRQETAPGPRHVDVINKTIPGIFGWAWRRKDDFSGIVFKNKTGLGQSLVDDVSIDVGLCDDHIPALQGVNISNYLVRLRTEAIH